MTNNRAIKTSVSANYTDLLPTELVEKIATFIKYRDDLHNWLESILVPTILYPLNDGVKFIY